MVKLHELILTFDTNKSNELIEAQAIHLIDEINKLLSKHFKDTLPQVYKDPKKKSKISVVPIAPEDLED
jgi:Cdc6-like AAA superfamily ATPase